MASQLHIYRNVFCTSTHYEDDLQLPPGSYDKNLRDSAQKKPGHFVSYRLLWSKIKRMKSVKVILM